jgi:signal transduction histidine kinase
MKEFASAIALCETDGRVVAGQGEAVETLLEQHPLGAVLVSALAAHLNCLALPEQFARFVASGRAEEPVAFYQDGHQRRILLRRLAGPQARQLVLVELQPANGDSEQAVLSEVGRITSRLVHDFKNQMGGLKLYAAFLKKRFADQPEGVEISEKIINALNSMSEHANLVTRLVRPINLNCEPADLALLVTQVLDDLRQRAAASSVEIVSELGPELPALSLDAQQTRAALYAIFSRAINSSPAGGQVRLALERQGDELRLEITDSGETIDEQKQAGFFDFLSESRLSETRLSLALAKRIIEQHGGRAEARAAPRGGALVRLHFPIRPVM